jgi:hypothetical protein
VQLGHSPLEAEVVMEADAVPLGYEVANHTHAHSAQKMPKEKRRHFGMEEMM